MMELKGNYSGYGEATSSEPPNVFFTPIVAAHEELGRVEARIADLADRLCGSAGEAKDGGGTLAQVPNGVFADISERGLDMGVKLDRIRHHIARIEKHLP